MHVGSLLLGLIVGAVFGGGFVYVRYSWIDKLDDAVVAKAKELVAQAKSRI